jgi:hypothetical protein
VSKLVAAMVFATLIASPALAQSYDPSVGSGNIASAPYRVDQAPQSVHQAPQTGNPYAAYAQTPHARKGPRSPYAQYDQDGNLIDENMPGRW